MKLRRVSGIILTASLAVVLLCTVASAQESINVLMLEDPFIYPLQKMIPDFEKETGIKVNMEGISWMALRPKAMMDFVSEAGAYDVINMDDIWGGEWAPPGYLRPLDDLIERDAEEVDLGDFAHAALGMSHWEGKQYGLPHSPYAMMYYYRTDVFEQYGVTLPKDLMELREIAKKLNGVKVGDETINGIALAYQRGAPIVHFFTSFFANFGARWFKEFPEDWFFDKFPETLTPVFNSPEGVEALEYYKSLIAYSPKGWETFTWWEPPDNFQRGKVAMAIQWGGVWTTLFEDPIRSKAVGKTATAVFPGYRPPRRLTIGGHSVVMNADSKNVEAAWKFIKWITAARTQRKWELLGGYSCPSRLSVLLDPEMIDIRPFFPAISEVYVKAWAPVRPRFPLYADVEEIFGIKAHQAAIGQFSPKEALDQVTEETSKLLKKEGYLK